MGLLIDYDIFDGSYARFNIFRTKLQAILGITDESLLPYLTPEHLVGVWRIAPAEPLHVLLAHADDKGRIYREHLLPVAKRLESLMEQLKSDDDTHRMAKQMVRGLKQAASDEAEYVQFG